jgi:hypothetical protein
MTASHTSFGGGAKVAPRPGDGHLFEVPLHHHDPHELIRVGRAAHGVRTANPLGLVDLRSLVLLEEHELRGRAANGAERSGVLGGSCCRGGPGDLRGVHDRRRRGELERRHRTFRLDRERAVRGPDVDRHDPIGEERRAEIPNDVLEVERRTCGHVCVLHCSHGIPPAHGRPRLADDEPLRNIPRSEPLERG